MKNAPSRFNLCTRLILVLIGIVSIILLPAILGWESSYSQYYQYIPVVFTTIFSILSIGLYIHSNNQWRVPSVALICLTVFDMFNFPLLHYSCAIFFFMFATFAMWNDKRVSGFGRVSLLLYPIIFFNLMAFEITQILIICGFQLLYIIKLLNAKIEKKIIEDIINDDIEI